MTTSSQIRLCNLLAVTYVLEDRTWGRHSSLSTTTWLGHVASGIQSAKSAYFLETSHGRWKLWGPVYLSAETKAELRISAFREFDILPSQSSTREQPVGIARDKNSPRIRRTYGRICSNPKRGCSFEERAHIVIIFMPFNIHPALS